MLAAAQREDDGAFFLSHPPPSHSLVHGSYVQPGGAAVLLFSWEGEVTVQPCGGEEEEEEEEMVPCFAVPCAGDERSLGQCPQRLLRLTSSLIPVTSRYNTSSYRKGATVAKRWGRVLPLGAS